MGFDRYSTRLVLLAKKRGADLSRTLTLGRQGLHLKDGELETLLRDVGVSLSSEQRQEVERQIPHADGLLKALGAETLVTVDASAYEGASVIHDMNMPIPETLAGKFTTVIDFGTLEHIFNFPVAIRNCMRLLNVGGSFLCATTANNYLGHGFYQFSPELFFRVLSRENGFTVNEMYLCEDRHTKYWYQVPDPAEVRSRVELRNSERTLMLIRAQKIADVVPFATAPQQSDYAQELWQGREPAPGWPGAVASNGAVCEFGRQWVPAWLRNLRADIVRTVTSPFAAAYYRRIDNRSFRD
jgi:SAM-dependent methyltransferase